MKLFSFLTRTSPGRIFWATATGMISGISSAGLIAIINRTLSGEQQAVTVLVGVFLALCLVVLFSNLISRLLLIRLGQGTVFEMRMRLSRRILSSPLRQLEKVGPHRLMVALTDDVQVITAVLLVLHQIFINAAIVVGCLAYLAWLSWTVFLAVLGFLILGTFTYQFLIQGTVKTLSKAREEQDSLFKQFRAMIEGSKELKLHRQRRLAFTDELLEDASSKVQQLNVTGMSRFAFADAWGQILFFVLIGLLLYVAPSFWEIQFEILTGYTLAILFMKGPLEAVITSIPTISRGNIALRKVEKLGLSLEETPAEQLDSAAAPVDSWQELQLAGVTHEYKGDNKDESFTLGPIDLTLRQGELLFLVGGNGSGKTTLAKLISGLYTPQAGEIRIDGKVLSEERIEQYRQQFSAVFSDFFLFDELLGQSGPDIDQRADEYLSKLHLDKKVSVQNGQLSTTELSDGQRKRLALLTAYLEDRPFYIFDEWAADQDPVFKEIFYRRLLPELKARGKTTVAISHDDRYYDVADRVIKLDYGQLVGDA